LKKEREREKRKKEKSEMDGRLKDYSGARLKGIPVNTKYA